MTGSTKEFAGKRGLESVTILGSMISQGTLYYRDGAMLFKFAWAGERTQSPYF
jgi:hypothetical protein